MKAASAPAWMCQWVEGVSWGGGGGVRTRRTSVLIYRGFSGRVRCMVRGVIV